MSNLNRTLIDEGISSRAPSARTETGTMSAVDPRKVTATVTSSESIDTGFADAFAEGNPWFPQLPAAKQAALHAWVYRAFFRRTSKLDQDFTVAQGGSVHFNTVADPNYNPATGVNNMQDATKRIFEWTKPSFVVPPLSDARLVERHEDLFET